VKAWSEEKEMVQLPTRVDVDGLQLRLVQVEQWCRRGRDVWLDGQLRSPVPRSEGDFNADVEVVQ
jgi:hypothetical protein